MKTHLIGIIAILLTVSNPLKAAQPVTKKPPVGVPADAKLFNGKWYRIYLESVSWKTAKVNCERLDGQLAVIPDAPTNAFIQQLSNNLGLWLGAYEKVEGQWMWLDGTPMKFTGWARKEPDNSGCMLNVLAIWKNVWWDDTGAHNKRGPVVGYVCEWKDK